jgi:G3E family GTPase
MLGGFLGAGKTTTVLRTAQYFQRLGKRVGLITNDQAAGLVDTALLEELNLPVQEIAGGCFCCKSEGLVEALARLTTGTQPEIFIAEPVGSCTDLVATVSLPLERIYKRGYVMAPYAVLIDPYRAMQTLGVEGAPLFSADVNYIYRKQLEEAQIIVINKVDVMNADRLARLRRALEVEYPDAQVMELASRPGLGMEPLFEALGTTASSVKKVMEVDYERYGVGEALLGWVNVQAELNVKPMTGTSVPCKWSRTQARRNQADPQTTRSAKANCASTCGLRATLMCC